MQFEVVKAATDFTDVYICEKSANYAESMALLQQKGLRPMTYQEALVLTDRNPQLKKRLTGKMFYLAGKSLEESGCNTFDNKGELQEGEGDVEKTVYAYAGRNPLSLDVLIDNSARGNGRRFVLDASLGGPQFAASVVVGVKTGHEVAKGITPELKNEFRK